MQGAPLGNQFWKLRSKHGRDKLFATPDLMWEACCEYFQWCEDNPLIKKDWVGKDGDQISREFDRPFTLHGLCLYLDCNTGYFNDFEREIREKKDKESKDFSAVITHAKETIYNQKFSGAAVGFFNANIIARDLGLTDKTDNKHDVILTQITGMTVK